MKRSRNRLRTGTLLLLVSVALFRLASPVSAADLRRADAEALSVEMSNRLETMLETVIGKDRSLVKIRVELSSQPVPPEMRVVKGNLRRLPGVVLPEATSEKTRSSSTTPIPVIEKILVTVYLDQKLTKDKVELVKTSVPKWLGLDLNRGDTLKVELIPWRDIPPDDVAVKQLSFMHRNYWVIIGIAGVAILVFILFIILAVPTRKLVRERLRFKPQEQKQPDFDAILKDLKQSMKGTSQEHSTTILEDIKEILAKAPSRVDSLLEDIKGVLEAMAEKSALGGGGGGGAGAAIAAPPPPGAPGFTSNDFLAALKDTIAPGTGGAGGTGTPNEMIEVLQKIEELSRKQVEAMAGTKTFDEPYKYMAALSVREILYYIEGEAARIAALILGHIDAHKSSEVLVSLPADQRIEISLAMAGLVETDKVALEVRNFIQRKMPEVKLRADFNPIKGSKALADILSTAPAEMTNSVLGNMEKENPSLAAAVKREMFLFADILRLDDKAITELLRSVAQHQLSLALTVATDEVKEKFFRNMTNTAVSMVKEEIDMLSPPTGAGGPKKIVLFQDILDVDAKTAQNIFKNIEKDVLKIALKGTSEDIRQKFYSLMTERAATILKEDIEVMATISPQTATDAQNKILARIRQLDNAPLVAQRGLLEKLQELAKAGRVNLGGGEETPAP